MNSRALVAAAGAGLTTFLVVAVLLIEALPFEFSAIVGLPAGAVVGVLVAALVTASYADAGRAVRAVVDGAAAFSYAALAALAVRYVDLAGLRGAVTLPRLAGFAAVVAVAVAAVSWFRE
jgi:hypothetical protein